MTFLGPLDYYFWQGIEAGVFNRLESLNIPMKLKLSQDCELSYEYGYAIGEEITKKEYVKLTDGEISG